MAEVYLVIYMVILSHKVKLFLHLLMGLQNLMMMAWFTKFHGGGYRKHIYHFLMLELCEACDELENSAEVFKIKSKLRDQ